MPKKHAAPKPPTQVEHKTTWATYAAGAYSLIVAFIIANPHELDFAPRWVQVIVAFIVGTGGVRLASFMAPHTTRTDVSNPGVATEVYDLGGELKSAIVRVSQHEVGTRGQVEPAVTTEIPVGVVSDDAAPSHTFTGQGMTYGFTGATPKHSALPDNLEHTDDSPGAH